MLESLGKDMVRVYKVGRNHRMEGEPCSMSDNGVCEENLLDKRYPLDRGHFTMDGQEE